MALEIFVTYDGCCETVDDTETSGTGLITGIGLTDPGDLGPVGDLDRILNVGAFGFPNV